MRYFSDLQRAFCFIVVLVTSPKCFFCMLLCTYNNNVFRFYSLYRCHIVAFSFEAQYECSFINFPLISHIHWYKLLVISLVINSSNLDSQKLTPAVAEMLIVLCCDCISFNPVTKVTASNYVNPILVLG